MSYPLPGNEDARLGALRETGIIGTPPEAAFDTLAALTGRVLNVPIALISLLDESEQWFKAHLGLDNCSTARESAFCNYPVASGQMFVVEDATQDARFAQNDLVVGPPHIRFYAGVPLSIDPGFSLGTLCVIDTTPRQLTQREVEHLLELAGLADVLLREFSDRAALQRLNARVSEQALQLKYQKLLFDRASSLAKLGAWEWDLASDNVHWTDGMYDIHDLSRGSKITKEQAHALYAQPDRDKLDGLIAQSSDRRQGYRFEGPMTTAKGQRRWVRLIAEVECEHGEVVRRYGVKQDVTEEKLVWDKMLFLSTCDPLTGLPHRAAFHARLEETLASKPRPSVALLMLDVDGFKHVNDTLGHSAGDECLKEIAKRLRMRCPDGAMVARLGGDEFGVMLEGVDQKGVATCVRDVLAAFRRPVRCHGRSIQLSVSVGVTVSGSDVLHPAAEFLKEADLAMYAAKNAGKNTFRFYLPDMKAKANERSECISAINAALERNQLALFYQPKIDLRRDGALAGFEALLRWRRPDGQIVSAGAFTAALLDPELGDRIGKWVVGEALRQARAWMNAGVEFRHIAINLSSGQFRKAGFSRRFIRQIADYGLCPEMIEVEVTESVFLDGEEGAVQETLLALRSAGIRISLDDFGTGYASLSHLRTFPVDVLKIDRSFVQHILRSPRDHALVQSMLFMAQQMDLEVVAEGIELPAQHEFLKARGCRYGQGYLFAKALPPEEAAAWCMPAQLKRA